MTRKERALLREAGEEMLLLKHEYEPLADDDK